jgi:hypothetical protein
LHTNFIHKLMISKLHTTMINTYNLEGCNHINELPPKKVEYHP